MRRTELADLRRHDASELELVLAWLAVGLPPAWGVEHTVEQALALFG